MPAPREALARNRAAAVLEECGIASLPVSPESIALKKKIALEDRSDFPAEVYGAIAYSSGGVTIFVSTACPTPGHRRFTIAHELGHFHIDNHLDAQMIGGSELKPSLGGHYRGRKDPIEVEADVFASELLMPERLVRRRILEERRDPLRAALSVAEDAKTSVLAAAIRTIELMDGFGAVVVSHRGSIEWTSFSPALRQHGFVRRPWRGEWAPRGSGAARLGANPSAVLAAMKEESGLLLCEWFADAPTGINVEEVSLGLGRYGRVLTMLRVPYLPDPDALYLQEQQERDEAFRAERDNDDARA